MPSDDRPQRVTLPTLQILAAFMSDPGRDDWYGRALSVHTGLGSGTVLQALYRLENWGWLESRWEDKEVATRDGRPPRRFYQLTGVGQREANALVAARFKGELRFAPGGGVSVSSASSLAAR
jgi:DNA-binding MarR family transcriptional regulator